MGMFVSLEECKSAWMDSGLKEALESISCTVDLEHKGTIKALLESIHVISELDALALQNLVFGQEEPICRLSLLSTRVSQGMLKKQCKGLKSCLSLISYTNHLSQIKQTWKWWFGMGSTTFSSLQTCGPIGYLVILQSWHRYVCTDEKNHPSVEVCTTRAHVVWQPCKCDLDFLLAFPHCGNLKAINLLRKPNGTSILNSEWYEPYYRQRSSCSSMLMFSRALLESAFSGFYWSHMVPNSFSCAFFFFFFFRVAA